jgi:hypothetical protein
MPGRPLLVVALMLAVGIWPAAAQDSHRDRRSFATLYVGQWMNTDLIEVPGRLVTANVDLEPATLVSGIFHRVLARDLRTEVRGLGWLINGSSIELEAQLGWHFGLQRHGEAVLALAWRSPDVTLPLTGLQVNFAAAEGFSYALSRPTFEGREAGRRARKFLNYLAFELEFTHPSLPGFAVVPRLHHRSGVFGLIAPHGGIGSDFLGVGLRVALN